MPNLSSEPAQPQQGRASSAAALGQGAPALPGFVTLRIGGAAQPEVDAAMLECQIEEHVDAAARCELLVQNWGPVGSAVGLRFDDRRIFDFGTTLELIGASGTTLFSGSIEAFGAEFPGDGQPRMRAVARGRPHGLPVARHGRGIADPLEAAPPTFTFGQDLLTFFVNAVAGAHPPSPSVSTRVGGIGRLAGLAESLHAGGAVDLAGLGRLHSGGYRVTVLRRHFNQSQGNFVEFEVQRHALGDA